MEKQYDVFICYGRRDYEIEYKENGETVKKLIPNNPILQIVEALGEAGITCWYDQEGVSADFIEYIQQMIESSRVMIFVSSQYSNQSKFTPGEILHAIKLGMPIIPFKIDKTEFNTKFGLVIDHTNTIDIFMTNPKKAIADLVKCVQKSLEQVHTKEEKQNKLSAIQKELEKIEQQLLDNEKECKEKIEPRINSARDELKKLEQQLHNNEEKRKELIQLQVSLQEEIKILTGRVIKDSLNEIPTFKQKMIMYIKKIRNIFATICTCIVALFILLLLFNRKSKLTVDPTDIHVPYADTTISISVQSNTDWKIIPEKGNIFDAKQMDTCAVLFISQNRNQTDRRDSLRVASVNGDTAQMIHILQDAAPKPQVTIKDNDFKVTNIDGKHYRFSFTANIKHLKGQECIAQIGIHDGQLPQFYTIKKIKPANNDTSIVCDTTIVLPPTRPLKSLALICYTNGELIEQSNPYNIK